MYKFIIALLSLFSLFSLNLEAFPYQTFKNHWTLNKFQPKRTANEYFSSGVKLLQEKKYQKALPCFLMITHHFKNSIYYQDSLLSIGQCFFSLNQYDLANAALSQYLTLFPNKDNFNLAINLKYDIAEKYSQGYRKHFNGWEGFPRIENSTLDAYKIYDEVYSIMEDKNLAAKALFSKASLLKKKKSLDEALTAFQDFIKQFPQHPFCLNSFIEISEIYLQQSLSESHNTTYLSLALLNQELASAKFPSCDELTVIKENINKMEEYYASNLFKLGVFYQKKNKKKAAKIYFTTSIRNYPNTKAAENSKKKLQAIKLIDEKN